MEKSKCTWKLLYNDGLCNRNCVGEYCAKHRHKIKNGSAGVQECIKCSKKIKGRTKLCTDCGGHRFTKLARYYIQKYNIVVTEHDYVTGYYKDKI